jgi:predicted Zn-ribbon and HTH transcriptional regulator
VQGVKVQRKVWVYQCERCGHEWQPRDPKAPEPKVCPKCKSPYWNTPRRNKRKDATT